MSYGVMRMSNSGMATVSSRSKQEARRAVLRLYRQTMKSVPGILRAYDMPSSTQHLRLAASNVRDKFENLRDVDDLRIIDSLRYKGELELQEALAMFKTRSHVGVFLKERNVDSLTKAIKQRDGPSEFLLSFLAKSR